MCRPATELEQTFASANRVLGPTSRDLGTCKAATSSPEPVLRDAAMRETHAAMGPTTGRRFADGVYETVELLAASYVAEGKSIPATARLAADQLVNNHPRLADELAAEAASSQGELGGGFVPDIAERSSESALQAGREVDGRLPDLGDEEGFEENIDAEDDDISGVRHVKLSEKEAEALARQGRVFEFLSGFDAERYAPIGGSSQKGAERFCADFNKPEVSDEIFDIAAFRAGFDPERARLFRDILNVDDESYDAVRDRLFSVFRNSGPIRAMLFSTLERISFTDDPEIRLDLLRQYFNRLRPIPGKEITEAIAVGGIFSLLRPRAPRSPAGRGSGAGQPQIRPLERTLGGNEEERLATIRRKVAAPEEFFDQRAGAAFDSIPFPPATANENVKRGLAAIDLALEDRLAGGQGLVDMRCITLA